MAVALNDLAGDGGGFESEAGADFFFELGGEVGEDADGAGEFSDAHVFGGGAKAGDVALGFRVLVGEFESEGDGLGVDAVSAADLGRVFEFPGAAGEDCGEFLQVLFYDLGGLFDQEGLGGIDDVVGGESVVEPAGFGADEFGDGGGEGDDVVADFGFDFVDALDFEVGALADGFGGGLGDESGGGEGFGGGDFDGEPGAEAVFVAPDAAEVGTSVARDHGVLLSQSSHFWRKRRARNGAP